MRTTSERSRWNPKFYREWTFKLSLSKLPTWRDMRDESDCDAHATISSRVNWKLIVCHTSLRTNRRSDPVSLQRWEREESLAHRISPKSGPSNAYGTARRGKFQVGDRTCRQANHRVGVFSPYSLAPLERDIFSRELVVALIEAGLSGSVPNRPVAPGHY